MNNIAPPASGDDLPDARSGREEESAHQSLGERPLGEPEASSARAASSRWFGMGWRILQSPLTNLVAPVITVLFILIAVAIIRETFRDVVVIRPIGVPASLADNGYTSTIVSQRLLDQIALINRQNEIVSRPFLKKSRAFYTELGEIDMQLPGLGLSLVGPVLPQEHLRRERDRGRRRNHRAGRQAPGLAPESEQPRRALLRYRVAGGRGRQRARCLVPGRHPEGRRDSGRARLGFLCPRRLLFGPRTGEGPGDRAILRRL
jgi:hypothetical protein